jgi:hypothetical protein
MQSEMLEKILAWPGVESAKSITLTLDGHDYEAALYVTPEGEQRIYALGAAPLRAAPSKAVYEHGEELWFIGTWADRTIVTRPEYRAYHPFGEWFGVFRWTSEHAIDAGEMIPYERFVMEIS